jgi:uncharacterized membrane protein YfcA
LINIFSFNLHFSDIVIIALVAMLTGMSKTGVHGAGMMAVPMLATVFGGRLSSGVLLPIMIFSDIFGVWYYHKHAEWKFLKKLFPWAALGVIAGAITGNYIDDEMFRVIMASIILVSIVIMIVLERVNKDKIPDHPAFTISTGVAGGFTSMVGNLSGSVMAVYFLSMRLPKNAYIGTTAWVFAALNLFKVPFHLFGWHTITGKTVLLDLLFFPMILLGAWLGIVIVKHLSEKTYRWFIIFTTLLAAVLMLL